MAFSSFLVRLFQSESVRNHSYENDFDLHESETACLVKGFALRLVLKQRHWRKKSWVRGLLGTVEGTNTECKATSDHQFYV